MWWGLSLGAGLYGGQRRAIVGRMGTAVTE